MRRVFCLALCLAVLAVGCGLGPKRVVGTWKGQISHQDSPKDLGEGIKGAIAGFVGDFVFQFDGSGRYKMTVFGVTQQGSYTVDGNHVKADSDDGKSHSVFTLSDDGQSLSAEKDSKGEVGLVLKKQ